MVEEGDGGVKRSIVEKRRRDKQSSRPWNYSRKDVMVKNEEGEAEKKRMKRREKEGGRGKGR